MTGNEHNRKSVVLSEAKNLSVCHSARNTSGRQCEGLWILCCDRQLSNQHGANRVGQQFVENRLVDVQPIFSLIEDDRL